MDEGLSTAHRRTRLAWAALCFVVSILATYQTGVLPILVPRLRGFFGISAARVGLLFSAYQIGAVATVLVSGPLADIVGPRRVLQGAYLGLTGAYVIAAIAPSFPVFFGAIVLLGVFVSAMGIALPMYYIELFPSRRRMGVSMSILSTVVPGFFFPVLADAALARWQDAFAAVLRIPPAAIAVAVGIAATAFLSGAPAGPAHPAKLDGGIRGSFRHELRGIRRDLPAILRRPVVLLLGLVVLHGATDMQIYNWLPIHVVERFPVRPMGPGVMLSLYSAAYLIARITLAALPDAVGRRVTLFVPGLVGGTLLLAGLLTDSATWTMWGYPAAALFWAMEFPAAMAEASRRLPQRFGTFQAVHHLLTSLLSIGFATATGTLVAAGTPVSLPLRVLSSFFLGCGLLGLSYAVGLRKRSVRAE